MNTKLTAKSVVLSLMAAGVGIGTLTAGLRSSEAQMALPRPRAFVSNLDLECFRATAQPPPVASVLIKHLNPVLTAMGIPAQTVQLGASQQVCAAVRKNNQVPPNDVLSILKYLDLACYKAAPVEPIPTYVLNLSQLNPAAANIPAMDVKVGPIQQLCTPVAKNNQVPPADVRRVIEQIDLACYSIVPSIAPPSLTLLLTQLNPVLSPAIPPATVNTGLPRQLCVPVTKNGAVPPADVTALIRWIDVEKFDTTTLAAVPVVPVQLRHLNPLFAGLGPFPVQIQGPVQLGLPVAKNGALPPL